jgi:hypothetical protein
MSYLLRPDNQLFRAKSLWLASVLFLSGAAIAGAFALELGLDKSLQEMLGATSENARLIALAIGGLAVIAAIGISWEWSRALRWIAVGSDGVRWFHGARVHGRSWNEFGGIHRKATDVIVNGQHVNTVHSAEIQFEGSPPLIVSPVIVPDYEDLLLAIEYGAKRSAVCR